MANASGMGLKREEGFPLRLTKDEMKRFKKDAAVVGLSRNDYARCKLFDISFDLMGGKSPRGRPKVEAPAAEPKTV